MCAGEMREMMMSWEDRDRMRLLSPHTLTSTHTLLLYLMMKRMMVLLSGGNLLYGIKQWSGPIRGIINDEECELIWNSACVFNKLLSLDWFNDATYVQDRCAS